MFETLAQNNAAGSAAMGIGFLFGMMIYLAIIILIIVGGWKMFAKAGQPGWAVLIPIFNTYILCKIVGRPGWWVILMLIPIVSLVIAIILMIDLAKSFGRGTGTAVGLILLGFIFVPILGFGSAEYHGPAAA
tara:strand:+ start:2116 stop:2511 length:396 start_codon:yes stop_codon:yes gene_type:complete